MDGEEARRRTRILVREAVRKRLVADVPLGALLSGGVDSSVVVGLMAELAEGPVRTFSIGFADDPAYDETSWARSVAHRFGTEHSEFRVEAGALELVEDLVRTYDEPFGDSSAIPTWLVSRHTRQEVTVALTGDGGDELFAGYARFLGMRLAEALPGPLVVLGDAVGRRLPHHPDFRHPTRRFSRFFRATALPAHERWLRWIGFFPDDPWALLREEVRERAIAAAGDDEEEARADLLESFRRALEGARGATPLGRALALNFHTYLPEDLLVKADRNSMAHGLELRSPFLDTELVEFAASLPDGVRNPRFRLKGLLKDSFRDLLPPGVRKRSKMGFGIPLPLWFRTHWKGFLEDTLLAPDARVREWLRPEAVRNVAEDHWSGRRDEGHQLWALLTLEIWLRERDG
jgi:asparagine synthase (glutamine-hydrolysing)